MEGDSLQRRFGKRRKRKRADTKMGANSWGHARVGEREQSRAWPVLESHAGSLCEALGNAQILPWREENDFARSASFWQLKVPGQRHIEKRRAVGRGEDRSCSEKDAGGTDGWAKN